jgi:hypothetical protein
MSNGVAQSAEEALYKPYDQFILFGDSITQMSSDQSMGFGFHAALQDGNTLPVYMACYWSGLSILNSLQPTAAAWM